MGNKLQVMYVNCCFTFAMADLHSPGAVKGAGVDLRVSRGQDGASRSSNITPAEC